jgi:hypothetical protein
LDIIHENLQIYDEFPRFDKQWTLIECKIAKIEISINLPHIITRVQFPIHFVVAWIIHRSQWLTIDHLTVDLTSVTKHDITYITLSKVRRKEILYLLSLLLHNVFQVYHLVQEKMFWLRTNAQYKLTIVFLKSYHSKFLIVILVF